MIEIKTKDGKTVWINPRHIGVIAKNDGGAAVFMAFHEIVDGQFKPFVYVIDAEQRDALLKALA